MKLVDRLWHGFLTVLIALVVALRMAAHPVVTAGPNPGVMTICAGGQVYYVSLDGTPVGENGETSEPCPYSGITLDLVKNENPVASLKNTDYQFFLPIPSFEAVKATRTRQNEPRAPPLPV